MSRSTPFGKKDPKQDDKRGRILRAAERLFLHYGPAKTTIADIARASEVGVGTVYLSFDSKEAILRELATEKGRVVAGRMREAVATAGDGAATQLERALEARVRALLDLAGDGQHACDVIRCALGARGEAQKPALPVEPGFGTAPRAVLATILERGVSCGELEVASTAATLDAIEIAFAALTPPVLYQMERGVAETRASALAKLVAKGLSVSR